VVAAHLREAFHLVSLPEKPVKNAARIELPAKLGLFDLTAGSLHRDIVYKQHCFGYKYFAPV
jgi:hypothetical protein